MIIMASLFKSLFILYLLTFVIGCASLEKLKFWGDEEEIELPASLTEFEQSKSIVELWSFNLGKYELLGRITPSLSSNSIFYITSEGKIFVIDTNTGKELWTKDTGDIVSGGIESKFKTLIYGTLDGEVVVLDQVRGNEIWRAQSTGEILSSPLTDGSIVAAQSSDGSLTGFDLRTGIRKWVHNSTVPSLSLRGTATPILELGFIFTGFANGKVVMIYPESGAIRLEFPVTFNEGTSELERIIDVDGKSIVSSNTLVSASYQGNITAIDLEQGRPIWKEKLSTIKDLVESKSKVIAINDKDIIKGFGLSTGVILWQQNGLKLRGLTSPVNIGGNIAVGDFEGYIHILNASDGSFLGRSQISKNPILEIVSEGDKLAVTDVKGRLFFLSIK